MIQLTDVAKEEVMRLIKQQTKAGMFLRVGVKTGGCSGLTYDVKFDDQIGEHDRKYEVQGIEIVSDPKSLLYLEGMVIDYSRDLVGGGFKFTNPVATGTCGCGTSFSVKGIKAIESEAKSCGTPPKPNME